MRVFYSIQKNVSVCLPKPGYPNPTLFLPKQNQEDPAGLKPLLQLNANPPPTTSMPPRGRSSSSPLINPPLLIVIVPIIAFAFLFFAVRPFLSLTSLVLRPNTVKKSWDSVNIFLVLFAILCGIFARKNDDGLPPEETANASSASNKTNEGEGEQSTSQQWFRYSETKIYDTPRVWSSASPATGVTRLKRSSSSYPDLRQESLWETGDDRFQFRFFDDFEINKYRSLRPRNEPEEPEKIIPVDTFALRSSPSHPPPPPKSPPPPPTPPQAVYHLPKRTYRRTVGCNDDNTESTHTRPPPPPPPIPPPSPARIRSEQKHGKSERSKSSFKKELAMAWNSLYKQRKRKRNKIKTNVFDEQVQSPGEPVRHTRPPPPPPPPPSVFHSLFRKGSKRKKVHSVSTPPPPPPPPPPPVRPSRSSERKIPAPSPPPEPSRRRSSSYSTAGLPPLPTRANTWDENVNGVGGRSPVIPIPMPPPPFKMPEMRFVAREGSVRVRSAQNSRCGSPELGDADATKESLDGTVNAMDGGGSVFCPSPDVNVKAETFIARLRDGWRLEKMNSYREKEKMGLRPGLGP
ncbi:hypothetical protein FH972_003043 [Carpinus fangiana]|uniref:Uncharacterized protein n=1 Tax=Carpinus fangiana TaxID=176857 RepID=A0A5N6QJW2_9ROSI|nr:hypothetical protein FH972_003043 [Carpinus fangiana]